ncbi:MAG: T9SS type A sorting domain-containing protein [Ginsengibacter sp.]
MKNFLLLATVFFYGLQFTFSQSGQLDPSFGNKGIVKTDMGSAYNYSNYGKQVLLMADGSIYLIYESAGVTIITKKNADGSPDLIYGNNGYSVSVPIYESHAAMQTDGKIIVVGYTLNADQYYNEKDFAVARLNIDGSLDNTFGESGITATDFGGNNEQANAVAIQSDGKIIVAGFIDLTYDDLRLFAVTRYNADGTPDDVFGRQQTSLGYESQSAKSVAIQSNGKIVVAGDVWNGSNSDFAVIRYNRDGSIDNTFSGDGIAVKDFGHTDLANAVAIQTDGRILIAGSTNGNFGVIRYNINGTLDNTFDSNGAQTTDFGGTEDNATAIAIQGNGKIIVGGYAGNGNNNNFAVLRYHINGSLDNSFSGDGKLVSDFGSSNDYANSIVIQSDGKVMALGYTISGTNTYVAAARYNTDGTPDDTFDGDGKLIDHVNQGSTFYAATIIQSDGKILAAGHTWNGSNYDFALVRYNTDGSLDNSFSGDGKQVTDFGSSNDYAKAIAIQSDGKILLAGRGGNTLALARYNSDGSLDNSFSGDGKRTDNFGSSDSAVSITIQPDGKILAGGSVLARYNINGSTDNSFGENGKLTTPFTVYENDYAFNCNDIALQNDGKIVIVGVDPFGSVVARYNTDGTADSTFDEDGQKTLIDESSPYFSSESALHGKSIAIQNDGNIVVGGDYEYNYRGIQSPFALIRLNPDGKLDDSFNSGGVVFTYINSNSYATSVFIQSDNKIILGGYSYNGSSDNFTLSRYNADGSLDNTFNSNGTETTQVSGAYDRIASIAVAGNNLYAVGYGQYPGNLGVVARYLFAESGPLPVSILDFEAHLQNKSVLLQWKIATEKNLTNFVIERGADGNRFLPIRNLSAAGVSTLPKNFSTSDEQPLQGINFYRLKMIDVDGKFTYSNTIAVKINADNTLRIFPNPAKRILFATATATNNEVAVIRIVDQSGRKLKEMHVALKGKTSFSIDITNLISGVYNLILCKKEKTEVQTFIKN